MENLFLILVFILFLNSCEKKNDEKEVKLKDKNYETEEIIKSDNDSEFSVKKSVEMFVTDVRMDNYTLLKKGLEQENVVDNLTKTSHTEVESKELQKNKVKSKKYETELGFEKYNATVTADILNLRKEPNVKSKILHKLKKDEVIGILSKEERSWVYVKYYEENLNGWVFTKFIDRSDLKSKINEKIKRNNDSAKLRKTPEISKNLAQVKSSDLTDTNSKNLPEGNKIKENNYSKNLRKTPEISKNIIQVKPSDVIDTNSNNLPEGNKRNNDSSNLTKSPEISESLAQVKPSGATATNDNFSSMKINVPKKSSEIDQKIEIDYQIALKLIEDSIFYSSLERTAKGNLLIAYDLVQKFLSNQSYISYFKPEEYEERRKELTENFNKKKILLLTKSMESDIASILEYFNMPCETGGTWAFKEYQRFTQNIDYITYNQGVGITTTFNSKPNPENFYSESTYTLRNKLTAYEESCRNQRENVQNLMRENPSSYIVDQEKNSGFSVGCTQYTDDNEITLADVSFNDSSQTKNNPEINVDATIYEGTMEDAFNKIKELIQSYKIDEAKKAFEYFQDRESEFKSDRLVFLKFRGYERELLEKLSPLLQAKTSEKIESIINESYTLIDNKMYQEADNKLRILAGIDGCDEYCFQKIEKLIDYKNSLLTERLSLDGSTSSILPIMCSEYRNIVFFMNTENTTSSLNITPQNIVSRRISTKLFTNFLENKFFSQSQDPEIKANYQHLTSEISQIVDSVRQKINENNARISKQINAEMNRVPDKELLDSKHAEISSLIQMNELSKAEMELEILAKTYQFFFMKPSEQQFRFRKLYQDVCAKQGKQCPR